MRADRLIAMLMLLQTNGRMTAQALAERLEVSTRTIYRDIDALSAAGVPVYAERGAQGGCMLMEQYRTNLTGLNEAEVRALFTFAVPGLLADLGADKASAAAMLKLTAALPAPFQRDAQRMQARFYLDPNPWFQADEPVPYLHLCQEAVWNGRRLRMQYRRSDGQWVKRLVDPYGLVAKAGAWYMVGAIYGGMPMVYRVSRIQEAAVSTQMFQRPPDFDLAAFWQAWVTQFETQQAAVTVTLWVTPDAAADVAAHFGEGIAQQLAAAAVVDADGAVQMQITFASLAEACRRLLGWGTAVRVAAPDALRTEMRRTAWAVLQAYTQD